MLIVTMNDPRVRGPAYVLFVSHLLLKHDALAMKIEENMCQITTRTAMTIVFMKMVDII